MIIHATNVYIGEERPKKKSALSRALKKNSEDADEDSPVVNKLSSIADLLRAKKSSTSHIGGG
jgi:hypothetical protein